MAYSRVTRTANGRGAIEYAQGKGKGHNGKENRNEYIGMVNMFDGMDPITQMQKYWMRAGKNHTTQVLRIVQSFSKNELDSQNRNDILTANEIGMEFAREFYPGRQSIIFTQTDGKSGLIHNHIIVNDVHMQTSKGCKNNQYYWPNITKWTDKVASRYFELDDGKENYGYYSKITQMERVKKDKDTYSWKEDIRERIAKSAFNVTSVDVFFKNLEENGVGIRKGKSKKYGAYYTYELKDLSNVPEGTKLPNRALKSRSYKLGKVYSPYELNDFFKDNLQEQQEAEAKRKEEEARIESEAKRKVEEERKKQEALEEEQEEQRQKALRKEKVDTRTQRQKDVDDIWQRVQEKMAKEREEARREAERREKEQLEKEVEKPAQIKVEKVIDYSKKINLNADKKEVEEEKRHGEKMQSTMKEEQKRFLGNRVKSGRNSDLIKKQEALMQDALRLQIEDAQDKGIDYGY
ncbi:relaxase/mobilization nuclease domain-containing protein [Eremococcus coleocola]|nr:relaxase/mobilization nuclease domain-containing protein [Eremococcus coleocola]